MALNLSRNTKLFVSTKATGNAAADTWEVPVLDGYSFSQEADSETITLNEAGDAPVRGQKIFNTALTPADISIPTYVRPFYNTTHAALEQVLWEGLVGPGPVNTYANRGLSYFEANFKGSNQHELLKLFLFFQLENTTYRVDDVALNSAEIDFSIDGIAQITWNGQGSAISEVDTSGWGAGVEYTAATAVHTGGAEAKFIKNKLSSMLLKKATGTDSATIFAGFAGLLDPSAAVDYDGSSTYTADITVDGGSAQTISIDSSAWSGTTVQDAIDEINYQLNGVVLYFDAGNLRLTSSTSGTTSLLTLAESDTLPLLADLDTTNFVSYTYYDSANGASTAAYVGIVTGNTGAIPGFGTVKTYNVPITGGSITIDNGITFLTPEELGKVNVPIGSFTGARAVSGSVTAYLNTGSTNTGGLLTDLATDTTVVTHEFEMTMSMGGGANTPRVDFIMNHAHLVIPSINVEDVISTEISFTGLGEEIDTTDELVVRYVSPTS